MRKPQVVVAGLLWGLTMSHPILASSPKPSLAQYDVVWNTPSADARGSMPLGNGEVGISAWVEADGDLQFYISRSDSYSEVSRLLKVGLIRVHLSPNPFQSGAPFSQRVHLQDGVIEIAAGGQGSRCDLKLFVDADQPVVHCTGTSQSPMRVTVTVERWRTATHALSPHEMEAAWTMKDAPFPLVESADVFPQTSDGALVWYHRNEASCVPSTLALQGLTSAADVCHDPLLRRTFGGLVEGVGFEPAPGHSIMMSDARRTFAFRVAAPCAQTATANQWIALASSASAASADPDAVSRGARRWWNHYWDNAWMRVTGDLGGKSPDDADRVTRGYLLQRYMQACGGRGAFPIKFNGGQFTIGEGGAMEDADWRRWGDCHWWQNARLMYHPMLAQGDFAMMDSLFRMYEAAVPLGEARAKKYENVQGCFFPETMTVWGTYANSDYGWDRTDHPADGVLSPWWGKTRNQGPELLALMLDRWDYTQDKKFLRDRVLPMATTVLTYFDQRYRRDAVGKIVLDPTQAVETLWTCVDDTPTVAGLNAVTARLTALPADLTTTSQKTLFQRLAAACPAVPTEMHKTENGEIKVIAPARTYDPHRTNIENPETYAIWPFRLYGVGKPDLKMARDTYDARVNHLPLGWGYDGNCAAVLGMADEAASNLQQKCANSNTEFRWPATWGPNYDWLPDQNHGGNLLETAQLMALQSDGRKILLFPAWPKSWDVEFKLHAAYNTTVEATLKNGEVTRLVVTPKSRSSDVVNMLVKS